MRADSGKNLSLIDAVINSTVDSLRHEANICNRQADKRAQGRGPTGVELRERERENATSEKSYEFYREL